MPNEILQEVHAFLGDLPAPGAEETQLAGQFIPPAPGQFPNWVDPALQAGQVWAPQFGLAKKPIQKVMVAPVNPALPKMEFNVEAKKAKTWYRPTTKDELKAAIEAGFAVAEQMHHADEEDVMFWNPTKFPSVAHIGGNRLAMMQIHPDKQYLITHTALYKVGENIIAATISKKSMKAINEWQEQLGIKFIKWLGAPKFFVVDQGTLYV